MASFEAAIANNYLPFIIIPTQEYIPSTPNSPNGHAGTLIIANTPQPNSPGMDILNNAAITSPDGSVHAVLFPGISPISNTDSPSVIIAETEFNTPLSELSEVSINGNTPLSHFLAFPNFLDLSNTAFEITNLRNSSSESEWSDI